MSAIMVYVALGMVFAWFVQFRNRGTKRTTWRDRMWNSLTCSFFTMAICLPLFEYVPEVPESAALIVGCVVGLIGVDGISHVIKSLLSIRLGVNLHDSAGNQCDITEQNIKGSDSNAKTDESK